MITYNDILYYAFTPGKKQKQTTNTAKIGTLDNFTRRKIMVLRRLLTQLVNHW